MGWVEITFFDVINLARQDRRFGAGRLRTSWNHQIRARTTIVRNETGRLTETQFHFSEMMTKIEKRRELEECASRRGGSVRTYIFTATSVRFLALNFLMTLRTCTFTVLKHIFNSLAMILFDLPCWIARTTESSRLVRI
jgi:hypothetical protein